jgi:hypothetical protein
MWLQLKPKVNYQFCAIYNMSSNPTSSNTQNQPSETTCDICGLTFRVAANKEKHKELEHKKHQSPTGVR